MPLVRARLITALFKHPLVKLGLLGRIAGVAHRAAPLPNPAFFKVFRRALRLYLQERYTPEEACCNGMLDPGGPVKPHRDFISKKRMMEIQGALNPGSWTRLTEDKSIFYRYCMALRLPTPELFACFFKDRAGWSGTGSVVQGRQDRERFLCDGLPEEFVIKPVWGVYGAGIRIIHRSETGVFTDATGLQQQAVEVYRSMLLHPDYHGFVIQERLRNHSTLVRLSDTEYLQTVRVVTFVAASSECRILYALLKPIVGRNFVDNHDHGSTGNLHVPIDLGTGKLRVASIMTKDGSGEKTVLNHPGTGVPFEGFRLPLWDETRQLAMQAAFRFLPLRIIGWDIAITPEGPYIIEANAWADPFCYAGIADIVAALPDPRQGMG
ncbi:MAG: sugar-transfer associated ATP-grasp domain-containing protein [Thiogranum sp.]